MATFFQAETPAYLEKLPHINKEYAVKHIFNTRNHPRFKGELFSKWKTKERKRAEKRGRKTRERRRKRRERRRGKGGIAPGRWGNEAENTHKGNGKPKDGDRKDGKEQQEEREFGTKDTQGKYRACVRSRTQKRDKRDGQRL